MRSLLTMVAGAFCLLLVGCQSLAPQDEGVDTEGELPSERVSHQSNTDMTRSAQVTPSSSTTDTEKAYADIWQRFSQELAIKAPNDAVFQAAYNKHIAWYKAHPKHLNLVSQNAEPYLFYVVDALDKANLPLEIALIPSMESAYNPAAYNKGIAGMWQFTAATAKNYHLPMNTWYDGRKDVMASTAAVVKMMSHLHDYFGEDWLNAFAAYNSGEGRVMAAITKNKQANNPTDFSALDLPKSTKNYVPKLLALAHVIKNAERYGITLAPIANELSVTVVDLGQQLDLGQAASLAQVSTKTLKRLNPSYLQWSTPPQGPFTLLLPHENAAALIEAMAHGQIKAQLTTDRVQIQPGDSLALIAKRYHTSTEVLRSLNHLNDNNIIAGKYLLIPSSTTDTSNSQHEIREQYRVKSGDSLWKIAKKFGVSVEKLASWNQLKASDNLKVGQQLTIKQ